MLRFRHPCRSRIPLRLSVACFSYRLILGGLEVQEVFATETGVWAAMRKNGHNRLDQQPRQDFVFEQIRHVDRVANLPGTQ